MFYMTRLFQPISHMWFTLLPAKQFYTDNYKEQKNYHGETLSIHLKS